MDKEDDNIGSFYMGRTRPVPQPKRHLPPGFLTGIALIALGGIVWYAYPRGAEKYTNLDVPVVKADTAPIKEVPVEPGGMEVRHQDSTIFDPLENKPADIVEKLRPMPEEPLDKKEVIQPAKMEPKLELDLQMKDAGNGAEKIVTKPVEAKKPVVEAAKPVAVAPKKEPVKETPKAAAPAGNTYMQLGSYREITDAKRDWDLLKKKNANLLAPLTMKVVRVDLPDKGIYYRLHAGKVTEARAKEICAVLKTTNRGGCFLVK